MNKSIQPVISVIVPTRDRQELFNKAVQSVFHQTYSNIELIVVDDHSTVPPVIEEAPEHVEVKYHRNDKASGGAISRNTGVRLSQGEFICFLDDDDYYHENKLQTLFEQLCADSSLSAIFGRIVKLSEPDRTMDKKYLDEQGIIKTPEAIRYLHTNSSLIRRHVFEEIRFDETLQKFQDTQLHIELICNKKCKYVYEDVAYWNDKHGLAQITDMKTQESHLRSLINFKTMIKNLAKRDRISSRYYLILYIKYLVMLRSYKRQFGNVAGLTLSNLDLVCYHIVRFASFLMGKRA
tara:strand:+ start:1193 stop:2071 length:879 start_codon:yes stop_codon:yes gene_type:complete